MAEKIEELNVDLNIKQVASDDILKNMEADGQLGANQIIFTKNSTEVPMMPVGSIFASAIPITDARVHLLDGSTISQTGVYETFANLIKALESAGQPITCTQTEFDADVSTYGQCGKFVVDNNAGTIRLPRITEFIASNNGGQTIGLAQLDEFKSHNHAYYGWATVTDGSGSYPVAGDSQSSTNTSHTTRDRGGSETRPKNIRYPYYIVLASGYKSSQIVDVDNIMTEVNNKMPLTGSSERPTYNSNDLAFKPTNTELWSGNSSTSATIQDISNFDYILICGKTTRTGEYWTTALYPVSRILAEFNNGYQFRLVAFGGEANGNYEFGIRLTNTTSLTTYYTNLSWMRVMGIKF